MYANTSEQVLWPALHYAVPDAPKTKSFYESSAWAEYLSVNERFADAIAAVYEPGDVLFVNDYHLLLLPELLRARLPHAAVGFFLHVAFPSSEIFRCLAVREKLLRGVLAADLIGFQTASHARHFRQTVSRVLALEATPRGIQTDAHFVDVGVFPIGIDVGALTERRCVARSRRRRPRLTRGTGTSRRRRSGSRRSSSATPASSSSSAATS
jgi:trehalose-6-phosphate synthase